MIKKKKDNIRATFLIPRDEWEVFKLICARHRAYDMDTDKMRQCTASDKLREDILVFIDEQQDDIRALIAEIEQYNPDSPLLATLREFKGDEKEQ